VGMIIAALFLKSAFSVLQQAMLQMRNPAS
jgi:hypothetical protein